MSNQLPFNLNVSVDTLDVSTEEWLDLPDMEREEIISDYLSDEFGFCVNSFFWDEDWSNNEVVIEISEIDWDTSD